MQPSSRPFAFAVLGLALLFSAPADPMAEEGKQKLEGRYVWEEGASRGPLKAVFTPTGDRSWDVAFSFTFSGQPHTYRGTASGSLDDGALEGQVTNENRRRTFTFQGAFRGGVFEGTHGEIRRGRERRLGTLTLER